RWTAGPRAAKHYDQQSGDLVYERNDRDWRLLYFANSGQWLPGCRGVRHEYGWQSRPRSPRLADGQNRDLVYERNYRDRWRLVADPCAQLQSGWSERLQPFPLRLGPSEQHYQPGRVLVPGRRECD